MKFGQYELLERIAVGGMAEVYRGRAAGAEGFEKFVAIKRILPEYARDERFISMMLTEARIHSALSHRNIVQIHDLGISEDGEYFIVLEYVEGHDLRAVMEAAAELGVQIPDSLALHVADELAQALQFAHELTDPEGQPLGIIHRDVSPSNVLISNSGEVKLSDFGIAKRRHDHSVVGSLKGNLVYMSPEQARRVPLDRRTDVFSLGAVLFEMLTGQKLRDITDEVSGFREVTSGQVRAAKALRPDLPDAYESLLARALAANPADRFADAAAFGAAIRELARESATPVGPTDMKELLELLNPPRRARGPVERSKVIRLGPEFRALANTTRGMRPSPTDPPAPAGSGSPLAPGVVPVADPATKSNGNGGAVWADPAVAALANATPGPAPPRGPAAPAPEPPKPVAPAAAPPVRRFRLRSEIVPPQPAAEPSSGSGSAPGSGAIDPQATPPPVPKAQLPKAQIPKADAPKAEPFGSTSAAAVVEAGLPARDSAAEDALAAVPTPPPVDVGATPPPVAPPPGAAAATPGAAGFPPSALGVGPASASAPKAPAPAAPRFTMSPIATPAPKRRGAGGKIVLMVLVLLGAGAAVFHYQFMPLDVAAVWFKPARLSVSSDPQGATTTLDGRALPSSTPVAVEVRRDRGEHLLELTRPGSRPVRMTVRFDRTVDLAHNVSLAPEPVVPPSPPGFVPPAPTALPVATADATATAKVETPAPANANMKAKKKAKKKGGKKARAKKSAGEDTAGGDAADKSDGAEP